MPSLTRQQYRPRRPPPEPARPHCTEPVVLLEEIRPGITYSAVRHCPWDAVPGTEYCTYHQKTGGTASDRP